MKIKGQNTNKFEFLISLFVFNVEFSIIFFIQKLELSKKARFLKPKLNKALALLILFFVLSIQSSSAFLFDVETS
ncbi:MAG: hypothetical protein U9O78_03340, partial [Patescibacteria group bacterium]|nr:hypothetical protein [Patescibacteria group bacterium]